MKWLVLTLVLLCACRSEPEVGTKGKEEVDVVAAMKNYKVKQQCIKGPEDPDSERDFILKCIEKANIDPKLTEVDREDIIVECGRVASSSQPCESYILVVQPSEYNDYDPWHPCAGNDDPEIRAVCARWEQALREAAPKTTESKPDKLAI